jgi:hypothetical protein
MAKAIHTHSPELTDALRAIGIEPNDARRIVIELPSGGEPAVVHVELVGADVNRMAALAVRGATVAPPAVTLPPMRFGDTVRPGDTLVLLADQCLTMSEMCVLSSHIETELPGVKPCILGGITGMGVYRGPEPSAFEDTLAARLGYTEEHAAEVEADRRARRSPTS